MPPPSRRHLDALSACLDDPDGSEKQAAYTMGLTYDRMRRVLSELYAQLGVHTMAQAVAALNDSVPGWKSLDTAADDPRWDAFASRHRVMRGHALSPRVRWIILARDGFTCRYCGLRAPHVELQVDHVIAKANGGSDDQSNLVTACITCNLGKSSLAVGSDDTSSSQDNV